MRLYTQLNFGGNCEEAFRFYERHLGGKITALMRVRDLPPGGPSPGGSPDAVIHVSMDVAGGELIGNDVPADRFQPIRSSYLYLAVDSAAAAETVFSALADGGQVTIPLAETFFATRFGQLRDRFGVLWTILHQRTPSA
jgi:PhnB protein